ncbi:hypothetical protein HPB50_000843 [Hyalomma asiaticum]|uniref:Uncharacterized protein n=1 Tax=Hyalomma asiaticum TaxID=266040 RepID=A0ACB7RWY3_HYAAI|nr:hypothetical protein HPB50_000843 [Hyalomma asiaticum]
MIELRLPDAREPSFISKRVASSAGGRHWTDERARFQEHTLTSFHADRSWSASPLFHFFESSSTFSFLRASLLNTWRFRSKGSLEGKPGSTVSVFLERCDVAHRKTLPYIVLSARVSVFRVPAPSPLFILAPAFLPEKHVSQSSKGGGAAEELDKC